MHTQEHSGHMHDSTGGLRRKVNACAEHALFRGSLGPCLSMAPALVQKNLWYDFDLIAN